MAKTGIKIKRCNVGSVEAHNERSQEYLDGLSKAGLPIYFFPNLTAENRSWVNPQYQGRSCAQIFEDQKKLYREKVGQDPQLTDRTFIDKKTGKERTRAGWSPIREGVIPIKDETTLDDFAPIASWALDHGLNVIRIDIHRDEGHIDAISGDFKPNRHAHIVFDWLDHQSGKTVKLNANHMSELQTLIAEALGMERGEISDKVHIPSLEYKAKMAAEECKRLCREMAEIMSDNADLRKEGDVLRQNIREKSDIITELGEKAYNLEYYIRGQETRHEVLAEANAKMGSAMMESLKVWNQKEEDLKALINHFGAKYPPKGMFESEKTFLQRCQNFKDEVGKKMSTEMSEMKQAVEYLKNLPWQMEDAVERPMRIEKLQKRDAFDNDVIKQSYLDLKWMHPETFALLKQMNYQGLADKEKSSLLKGNAVLIEKKWHDPDDGHWSEEYKALVEVKNNELRFDGLSIREFFRHVLSVLKSKVKKIVGDTKAQKQEIAPKQEESVERRTGRKI